MTQQIFQATLAINATRIWAKEIEIDTLKAEARAWRAQGELSFAAEAGKQVGKERSKLRKLVALQIATKTELQALYRKVRIAKLYFQVFGKEPVSPQYTTFEQIDMLEKLLAEKRAHDAEVAAQVAVYE